MSRKKSTTRLSKKTLRLLLTIIVLAILSITGYCRSHQPSSSASPRGFDADTSLTAALQRVDIPDTIPCIPISYTGMNIGFNPSLHIPNWVAWQLTDIETQGTEPRTNKFLADDNIPGSADPFDYNYSGYDRGHMAPAGDMKWDKKANAESFYMTNIIPQVKALNTGTWKKLEEKCRQWARHYGDIYIVCGPILTDPPIEYIGDSRVCVPRRFFKAILALDYERPRAIGFIMPNAKVPGGMQEAAVSIDRIEQLTGYDLFSALPDDIESAVESECDFHYWSTLKTSKNRQ